MLYVPASRLVNVTIPSLSDTLVTGLNAASPTLVIVNSTSFNGAASEDSFEQVSFRRPSLFNTILPCGQSHSEL